MDELEVQVDETDDDKLYSHSESSCYHHDPLRFSSIQHLALGMSFEEF